MTADDDLLCKVAKYGKLIKRREKIGHALSRLNDIDMTLDILSATNIGRSVNKLCDDPEYGRDASRIIEKWKEVARQGGVRGGDEDEESSGREDRHVGHDREDQRQVHHEPPLASSKRVDQEKQRSRHDDDKDRHKHDHRDIYETELKKSRYDSQGERKRNNAVEDGGKRGQKDSSRHGDGHRDRSRDSRNGYDRKRKERDSDEEIAVSRKSRSLYNGYGQKSHDGVWDRETDGDREDGHGIDIEGTPPKHRERPSSEFKKVVNHTPPEERDGDSKPKTSKENPSTSGTRPAKKMAVMVTDFDMMLQSADTTPGKKKEKTRDQDFKWSEMPLLTNYQPFTQAPRTGKDATSAPVDDFNPENMFKPRNERGKVFAGRRKVVIKGVPSLFSLCLRVLSHNVKTLYYADYLNYDVIKPILEKCSAEDLGQIELKHKYLEEDSGELWQRFVNKKYPGEEPEHTDSWKELYFYLEKERDRKLKQLSLRIGKSHKDDAAKAPRKALLADAAAPAHIRRRQIQNGTGHMSKPLPSAKEVSSARRKIFETGGSKDALAALPQAVVNRNSTVGAKSTNRGGGSKVAPKKGLLMLKTMKMLNMKRK